MNSYRDQYEQVFGKNAKVKVLAISGDADTITANWAREASYPVTFVSDSALTLSTPYGVPANVQRKTYQRVLFVVGKDGKIAHIMRPFRELVQDSYDQLGEAVQKALAAP